MTGIRRIASNRVRKVGAQAHVFSQLPGEAGPQAISAIDAAGLFVSRTLRAEIEVQIEFGGGGNPDSARV